MTEPIKPEIRIKWLEDFYGWEWISPETSGAYFSNEDFISINGDVQLVKFDPSYVTRKLWIARNIDIFDNKQKDGFLLYQCDSPSKIRENIPIRFFYSKKYKKVFELKGSNATFYELFDFILKNELIKQDIFGLNTEEWFNDKSNIQKYVRIFFDNVTGRNGRFEIVEGYMSNSDPNNSYCLLYNRIKRYYELNPDDLKNSVSERNFLFHKEIFIYLNNKEKILKTQEDNKYIVNEFSSEKLITVTWEKCAMVFRSSLFLANATVDVNTGFMSLSNETLITEEYLQKINNNLSDNQIATADQINSSSSEVIYLLSEDELRDLGVNCLF